MSTSFPSSSVVTGEQPVAVSEKLDCSLEELIDEGRRHLLPQPSLKAGSFQDDSCSSDPPPLPFETSAGGGRNSGKGTISRSSQRWQRNHASEVDESQRPRSVTLKHNRHLDLAVRGITRKRRVEEDGASGSSRVPNSPTRHLDEGVRRVIQGVDGNAFAPNYQNGEISPRGTVRGTIGMTTFDRVGNFNTASAGNFNTMVPAYMPMRMTSWNVLMMHHPSQGTGGSAVVDSNSSQVPANPHLGYYLSAPYSYPPLLPNTAPSPGSLHSKLSPKDAALLSTEVTRNEDGDIIVSFKRTNIVVIKGDTGDLILDSGGFRTYSTRAVMNQALQPVGIQVNELGKGASPLSSSQAADGDTDTSSVPKTLVSDWQVSDGKSYLSAFQDGMVVKQSGVMSRQQLLARGSVIMQFLQQRKTNAEKQSKCVGGTKRTPWEHGGPALNKGHKHWDRRHPKSEHLKQPKETPLSSVVSATMDDNSNLPNNSTG